MKSSLLKQFITEAFITLLFFLLFPPVVSGQHYTEITNSNGEHIRIDRPSNSVSSVILENGKAVSVHLEKPDEVVSIIVIFKDEPLSIYQQQSSLQKSSLSAVYTKLKADHAEFRTALNTLSQQLSAQLKSDYSYTITHDYYRAVNGVSLKCKRGMIGKLRSLPMVKNISPDREFKVDLHKSVRQIRADIVHDTFGLTGKGVLVGNMDTGMDYNNPALGSGFGPAFRVIGGYDFINNDGDPMDDHGHGTHVAGIIGANSGDTLQGVAPDVKFLAVKVFNSEGRGSESAILAGLDYCLDPDANPATNDGADVINMSFGGTPYSDDPMESAVDNAADAGVLCIAAAGNEGYGRYGTVSSPGTSPSALTVGACDSVFNPALFSAMGPDAIHSSVKPEVLAPGVRILSTILNNQTESWSGTSMATPHVTGLAALLKEQHPSWRPGQLKAAIINSAHSLGDNVSIFIQGKGCIDALDAVKARMIVETGVMCYGLVDLAQDVWKDTLEMTIGNFRTFSQNTQIEIAEELPAGATLTFDKTSFSLAPGEEITVTAVLSVSSSVPIVNKEPYAYLGKIQIVSDSDNVIVPFTFIKASRLVVNLDAPAHSVMLIDHTKGKVETAYNSEGMMKHTFLITQNDSLEILTLMTLDTLESTTYYIVDHKINNPAGLVYAFVNHEEAVFNLIDTVYDINNNMVSYDTLSGMEISLKFTVGKPEGYQTIVDWMFSTSILNRKAFISPLDLSFLILKKETFSAEDVFFLKKSIYGLESQQDISIDSGPGNLAGYHIAGSYDDPLLINPPPDLRKVTRVLLHLWTLSTTEYGFGLEGLRTGFGRPQIDAIYFNKPKPDDAIKNGKYYYVSNSIHFGSWHPYVQHGTLNTPCFTIDNEGHATFEQVQIANLDPWAAMGGEISSAYVYQTINPGDTIKIEQNGHVNYPDYMTYIWRGSLFMKWNNDWYIGESYGGVKQFNGVKEQRDYFFSEGWNIPLFKTQVFAHNRALTNMIPYPLNQTENDIYRFDNMENNKGFLHILSNCQPYNIMGQPGICDAEFQFQTPDPLIDEYTPWSINLLGASAVFPSFNLLQVSADGKIVENILPEQTGIIRIIPFDPNGNLASLELSLLLSSGDEISLPVNYVGSNEYNSLIPGYLPKGFIDIRASIEDATGNKSELTVSPAFYFGSNTDSIKLDARLHLTSYALDNVDSVDLSTGDTLNYTLSYANYGFGTARDLLVTFPSTPYFRPIGVQARTIDSLAQNDTVHIQLSLEFLGKQQSTDRHSYYSPSISWTSGGTKYLRKHNVLVDFQNSITDIVQTAGTIPNNYKLYQNYPNPFNPSTTIKYDLPRESKIKILVYDILGREIATLADETLKAGSYQVNWNADRYASGVYFCSLEAAAENGQPGNYTAVKKLLLLK